MRQLTVQQVRDDHGGVLPPDAIFRGDDGPDHRPPTVAPVRKKGNRTGRFADLNAFVDFGVADAELTPAESLVWLVLFRDTKANTGTARTAQADIARRANLDTRTVRRAVAALETKGMLTTVRRGRLNCGPSVYRIRPTARP